MLRSCLPYADTHLVVHNVEHGLVNDGEIRLHHLGVRLGHFNQCLQHIDTGVDVVRLDAVVQKLAGRRRDKQRKVSNK